MVTPPEENQNSATPPENVVQQEEQVEDDAALPPDLSLLQSYWCLDLVPTRSSHPPQWVSIEGVIALNSLRKDETTHHVCNKVGCKLLPQGILNP